MRVVTGRSETRPPVSRRARGEGEVGGGRLGYFMVSIGDIKYNGIVEKQEDGIRCLFLLATLRNLQEL